MIPFRGRHKALQYMPDKPCKRGLKLFALCDSQSGYLHKMEIYQGKDSTDKSGQGLYFDVVDRLTRHLQGLWHRLYFDNLYASIPLLIYLLDNGIYAAGTMRSNRKFTPKKEWPGRGMERGDWRVSIQYTSHVTIFFQTNPLPDFF